MPTFKSLKLAQHKADKPIRPKPACLGWPVGPAELGLRGAPSAVLPLLRGLIFHLILTSQLLRKARLCRPDNKNRRVGEITIRINNHSVFKTQSRNSGLFNFIKELFFFFYIRHKLRLQFLWLPTTNVLWLNFSPNMNHSEKASKFVYDIYFVG